MVYFNGKALHSQQHPPPAMDPSPQKFRVAAVQMTSSDDLDANLTTAGHWIKQAANKGVDLVALPEFFPMISPDKTRLAQIAEKDGEGPMQDFLAGQARKFSLHLAGGTIPLKGDNDEKIRNSLLFYAPDGARLGRYDKIHLFQYLGQEERHDESNFLEAGTAPCSVETELGRIGLVVCYDLRFPALFRLLNQPDLIIAPSCFTVPTGKAHWQLLLRARAIDNLCYLLAPAQSGTHAGGRKSWGHSAIVDPWGRVLAESNGDTGLTIADIDYGLTRECRELLPLLDNQRL